MAASGGRSTQLKLPWHEKHSIMIAFGKKRSLSFALGGGDLEGKKEKKKGDRSRKRGHTTPLGEKLLTWLPCTRRREEKRKV